MTPNTKGAAGKSGAGSCNHKGTQGKGSAKQVAKGTQGSGKSGPGSAKGVMGRG